MVLASAPSRRYKEDGPVAGVSGGGGAVRAACAQETEFSAPVHGTAMCEQNAGGR